MTEKYNSPMRDAQSALTRAQIMQAAGGSFAEKGFSGTSIRDIAQASGVGVGTILYHFQSKENLILETIRHFALEMGRLNLHFAPLLEVNVSDRQAVADTLRDTIHSFLLACHGPDQVQGLIGLYTRVMTEGDTRAMAMLVECFAPVQSLLPELVKRIQPDCDAMRIGFWQQLLWSLLQYTVVSKQLVLYDMRIEGDYTPEYLSAAAWHMAWFCCLPLGLPAPRR